MRFDSALGRALLQIYSLFEYFVLALEVVTASFTCSHVLYYSPKPLQLILLQVNNSLYYIFSVQISGEVSVSQLDLNEYTCFPSKAGPGAETSVRSYL